MQPTPHVQTHHELPRACHFKWRRMFAPSAKKKGGAATRGVPGPADPAPRSWQIMYLKQQGWAQAHGLSAGCRAQIPNYSLESAFTKVDLPTMAPFKGMMSCQSTACAYLAELQDFKPKTCYKDSRLRSTVSGRLTRRKISMDFNRLRTSSFSMGLLPSHLG